MEGLTLSVDGKSTPVGVALGVAGLAALMYLAKTPTKYCNLTIKVDPPKCAGTHTTNPPPGNYGIPAGRMVEISFGELPGDCMGYDIDYWEIITPEGVKTVSDYSVRFRITGYTTVILHLKKVYE